MQRLYAKISMDNILGIVKIDAVRYCRRRNIRFERAVADGLDEAAVGALDPTNPNQET